MVVDINNDKLLEKCCKLYFSHQKEEMFGVYGHKISECDAKKRYRFTHKHMLVQLFFIQIRDVCKTATVKKQRLVLVHRMIQVTAKLLLAVLV